MFDRTAGHLPSNLLRSHIRDRSGDLPLSCNLLVIISRNMRETEIENLCSTCGQHHISGFQVTMDDFAVVCLHQSGGDVDRDVQTLRHADGPSRHPPGECLPFNERSRAPSHHLGLQLTSITVSSSPFHERRVSPTAIFSAPASSSSLSMNPRDWWHAASSARGLIP